MTAWQSGTIESNGIQVYYTRTGGDKPPLVLAHGFSDDGLCWLPVAEALAADYDIIMSDARGHGRSEGPESGYDHPEQARDLAGLITGLGLEKPAVLGHSMGAVTTLTLAGAYPDLPRAILLEDPPAWWGNDAATIALANEQRHGQRRASIIATKRKTREELIAEQRVATPGWTDGELNPWADSKLRLSFNVLNRPASPPVEWTSTLRQIACPALLITGDPSRGALVSAEAASALEAFVPHVRVANIPNTGHSIRRDAFAQYMEVVRGFLAEHTPTR